MKHPKAERVVLHTELGDYVWLPQEFCTKCGKEIV